MPLVAFFVLALGSLESGVLKNLSKPDREICIERNLSVPVLLPLPSVTAVLCLSLEQTDVICHSFF